MKNSEAISSEKDVPRFHTTVYVCPAMPQPDRRTTSLRRGTTHHRTIPRNTKKRENPSRLPPHHEKEAHCTERCHDGGGTERAAGEFDCGRAGHAGTARVPAAPGTASVPRAPGAGVADDMGVRAVVPGSATVKVMVLI